MGVAGTRAPLAARFASTRRRLCCWRLVRRTVFTSRGQTGRPLPPHGRQSGFGALHPALVPVGGRSVIFPGPDGPLPSTGEADRAVARGVDPPPPAEETLGAGESRPSLGITSEIGRRVALGDRSEGALAIALKLKLGRSFSFSLRRASGRVNHFAMSPMLTCFGCDMWRAASVSKASSTAHLTFSYQSATPSESDPPSSPAPPNRHLKRTSHSRFPREPSPLLSHASGKSVGLRSASRITWRNSSRSRASLQGSSSRHTRWRSESACTTSIRFCLPNERPKTHESSSSKVTAPLSSPSSSSQAALRAAFPPR